ncbi:MAG TPA: hypothetical protein VFZ69_07615 [Longimicrobiales bacterium]
MNMIQSAEMTRARAEAFITSYRAAFERRDVDAIVAHFGASIHVASDTGEGVRSNLFTHAEWRSVVEGLVSQYRALDAARAEVRSLDTTGISPRLFQAAVTWALFDGGGRELYEFRAVYTLVAENDAVRVTAIAHDEMAQARNVAR